MADLIIENDGEGYDIGCDCCDVPLGWEPTADRLPKRLALCNSCRANNGAEGCTDETLKRAAEHGDEDAIAEINRRSVRDNGDGTASFTGTLTGMGF